MPYFQPSINTKYLGKKFRFFPSLPSTNSYLLNDYKETYQEGITVFADEQTAGKGRQKRSWFSVGKKSLLFSVLLIPEVNPQSLYQLTSVTALAVTKAIEKSSSLNPLIKWPNDIYINDKKCCGILSETKSIILSDSVKGQDKTIVVMGVGLNVNIQPEEFPNEIKDNSTSLLIETGTEWDREILLSKILSDIELGYEQWKSGGYKNQIEEIALRFYLKAKKVKVLSGDSIIKGKVMGLSPKGYLLIKDVENRIHTIVSGDILLWS